MGAIISVVAKIIGYTIYYVALFAKWFYLTFLPFVIQYIALPMFVLGILIAVGFAGGTLIFTIFFFVFMYFFIRETIFKTPPTYK